MEKELIDMLERVLQEAITQDPFQGDDYELLHEAEALLAKAKAAQQSVHPTLLTEPVNYCNPVNGVHAPFCTGHKSQSG